MRILVTGATGPFGRAVCRRLVADGHRVTAMARRVPDRTVSGVDFAAGDVRDARAVRQAVSGCDAVVHLAWVVAPLKTEAETAEINLGATQNVLAAVAAEDCPRLVFSSSVLAYGAVPGHPPLLSEDATTAYALASLCIPQEAGRGHDHHKRGGRRALPLARGLFARLSGGRRPTSDGDADETQVKAPSARRNLLNRVVANPKRSLAVASLSMADVKTAKDRFG